MEMRMFSTIFARKQNLYGKKIQLSYNPPGSSVKQKKPLQPKNVAPAPPPVDDDGVKAPMKLFCSNFPHTFKQADVKSYARHLYLGLNQFYRM